MKPVRTRFAPSPTGYLHVGGIRTALFAWLLARQANGAFVLRLEDTDKKREVEGSAEHLIESLKALGLYYDEGPDIGGQFAPYRQSDRLDSYKKWAQKLIDSGRAYADLYSQEELQSFREQAQAEKRPFLFREHRPENPPVWDGSTPLRFKSDPKTYEWTDAVMGELKTGPEVIDDIILIKSDGYPTYNFAHIVDDAEMQISHVIRGQEFIASTPNYLNLYEALGLEAPITATMPHILGPDGNKKLSKRDGAKDVLDYIRDGYLPDALVNFIASLGWNDGTEQEIFSRQELVQKFSLEKVQRSSARFDEKRLQWMNGQHIRNLTLDELFNQVNKDTSSVATGSAFSAGARQDTFKLAPSGSVKTDEASHARTFWPNEAIHADKEYKRLVLSLVQDRLKTLAELPLLTSYFFTEPQPDWTMVETNKQLKKLEKTELLSLLQTAYDMLEKIEFTEEQLTETLNQLLEKTGQKPAVLFGMLRLALTWAPFSPGLAETMAVLGKEKSLSRIRKLFAT